MVYIVMAGGGARFFFFINHQNKLIYKHKIYLVMSIKHKVDHHKIELNNFKNLNNLQRVSSSLKVWL